MTARKRGTAKTGRKSGSKRGARGGNASASAKALGKGVTEGLPKTHVDVYEPEAGTPNTTAADSTDDSTAESPAIEGEGVVSDERTIDEGQR